MANENSKLLEKIVDAIEVIQETQADFIEEKEMLSKHNINPQAHPNIKLDVSNIKGIGNLGNGNTSENGVIFAVPRGQSPFGNSEEN